MEQSFIQLWDEPLHLNQLRELGGDRWQYRNSRAIGNSRILTIGLVSPGLVALGQSVFIFSNGSRLEQAGGPSLEYPNRSRYAIGARIQNNGLPDRQPTTQGTAARSCQG